MRCKFFKIEDTVSGYCRVNIHETGDKNAPRAIVKQDDSCNKWADCGQNYYIRLGWVKSQEGKIKPNSF